MSPDPVDFGMDFEVGEGEAEVGLEEVVDFVGRSVRPKCRSRLSLTCEDAICGTYESGKSPLSRMSRR